MIDTALVARPPLNLASSDSPFTRALDLVPRAFRWLVPDVVREVFAATMAFERILEKNVGHRYSPEVVLELQDDETFVAARRRLRDAAYALITHNPWLARGKVSAYSLLPRPLRQDHEMRTRAERMAQTLNEVSRFARAHNIRSEADEWSLIPGIDPVTPRAEQYNASPWFIADSGVPVEIAEHYLDAYVAQTTCSLARTAGKIGAWPLEDLRKAVTDWTSQYERALVFVASLPNADIPSLSRYDRLDLATLVSKQNKRRRAVNRMAEAAASSLHKRTE